MMRDDETMTENCAVIFETQQIERGSIGPSVCFFIVFHSSN